MACGGRCVLVMAGSWVTEKHTSRSGSGIHSLAVLQHLIDHRPEKNQPADFDRKRRVESDVARLASVNSQDEEFYEAIDKQVQLEACTIVSGDCNWCLGSQCVTSREKCPVMIS